MRVYKLYANVNPLEPSTQIVVATSTGLCMGPEQAKEYLMEKGKELKAKGYKTSLTQIDMKTIKI